MVVLATLESKAVAAMSAVLEKNSNNKKDVPQNENCADCSCDTFCRYCLCRTDFRFCHGTVARKRSGKWLYRHLLEKRFLPCGRCSVWICHCIFSVLCEFIYFAEIGIYQAYQRKTLRKKWPYFVFALVFSIIFGGIMSENAYLELLTALNAVDFQITDPLFGRDIGYYIFIRPFFTTIVSSLKSVFLLQAILVTALYVIILFYSGIHSIKTMIKQERGALTHVLANVILYYITMIFSYRLTAESLMYGTFGGNGDLVGAGFIESNIWLPYYRIAPYVILAAVVLTVVLLWRKNINLPLHLSWRCRLFISPYW